MVEELKIAIKVDDDSVEQSLLKQFANAQKMADKVVLDFKNVNFDDKEIEAKFKALQKKAGQNPIDLSISKDSIKMLSQISDKLGDIFKIAHGKSIIDSSSTNADIGKIENKLNELTKKYEDLQKKASGGISGKEVNLVDNDEFKKLSQEVSELKGQFDDLKTHMSLLDDYTVPTDRFFELQTQVEATSVKVSNLVDEMIRLSNVQKNIGAETNISLGDSSTTSAIAEQNKLQEELRETREQAEQAANAVESVGNTSAIRNYWKKYGTSERDSYLTNKSNVTYDTIIRQLTEEENVSKGIMRQISKFIDPSNIMQGIDTDYFKAVDQELQKIGYHLDEIQINTNDHIASAKILPIDNHAITNAEEMERILKNIQSTSVSQDQMKDAIQVDDSDVSTVQKVADNFDEIKQNTEQATEAAENYLKIISQVGEATDDSYKETFERNNGQIEVRSYSRAKDEKGNYLYNPDGTPIWDESITPISNYQKLEKTIIDADNALRKMESTKKEILDLDSKASTTYIDAQIEDQKQYILLLEKTIDEISKVQREVFKEDGSSYFDKAYDINPSAIKDAREKAKREYELSVGAKQEKNNAKQSASDEQKRQKAIEQTNRLLNRQQITIDNIEKSYSKSANPDLDKSVYDTSDLTELANKKSEIQNLLNKLNGQDRNSSNEQEFLQLEKLISEYKQLAKDKLKANNPSKQELGGQDLKVLLEQQVSQYNQLILKAEKYGNATSDIVEKLKIQRDLIAQANSDGVYTAKSGLKADDYYSARDNYKIVKAQFSSYETDIKNTERLIQAQRELGKATTEARQAAKDSAQSSVDNALKDQISAWKNIQSIREKIAKTKDSDEIANLQQVKKKYQQNYIEADKILKANSSLYDKEAQIAKLEQIRLDTNKKISDYQDKQISGYDKRLESYNKKTASYDATIARFKDDGWTSDDYLRNVQAAKDAVEKYEKILNDLKTHPELVTEKDLNRLNGQEKLIKKNINAVQNMTAAQKGFTQLSGQKAMAKINALVKENSKMSRSAKNQIKAWYDQIKSGNPTASLDVILGKVQEIVNAEIDAGRGGKSMFDAIKEKAWYGVASAIGTYFGFNDILRYIGQGINTIRELDEAMTEVRKVSEATESQYESFQKTISATAKEIASTNKELLNSSADFLRLGYSLDEASDLAKNATLFVNVGDGVDINEATEDMITAMKAFDIKAEESIKIVDSYNQIGNLFALSASDIGEAMKRSASALETGNNSFEESIALITAMNEIVQNSENTGNTLKVLSLRLRGAKAELENMSEDTDGLCESTSKLREQIQSLTGVDIMIDENNFKSTAEIIKELGAVWDNLSDTSQAATLELIAGKSRSNNVAALLKNYKQIDEVLAKLENAEGSALRENEARVKSINGRIKILSATAEEFWKTFIDTDLVKGAISLLTGFVEVGTSVVDILNQISSFGGNISSFCGNLGTIIGLVTGITGHGKLYCAPCYKVMPNVA